MNLRCFHSCKFSSFFCHFFMNIWVSAFCVYSAATILGSDLKFPSFFSYNVSCALGLLFWFFFLWVHLSDLCFLQYFCSISSFFCCFNFLCCSFFRFLFVYIFLVRVPLFWCFLSEFSPISVVLFAADCFRFSKPSLYFQQNSSVLGSCSLVLFWVPVIPFLSWLNERIIMVRAGFLILIILCWYSVEVWCTMEDSFSCELFGIQRA